MPRMTPVLDEFTHAFLCAALWLSDPHPGQGEWSEHDDWSIANIDRASIDDAIRDCADFQQTHADDLSQAGTPAQNGHDFFLTRNHHGTGFWDRGYGVVGERLSNASKAYGTWELLDAHGVIYHHS